MQDPGDVSATTPATDTPAASEMRTAVVPGACAGLAVLAVVSVVVAVLDRRWDDFSERNVEGLLVAAILGGYVVAGWVAGRAAELPLRAGSTAAVLAFALWIPLRVLVWIVRDDDRGLFSGDDPVFTIGAVVAQVVLAAGFGLLGALAAERYARRRA